MAGRTPEGVPAEPVPARPLADDGHGMIGAQAGGRGTGRPGQRPGTFTGAIGPLKARPYSHVIFRRSKEHLR